MGLTAQPRIRLGTFPTPLYFAERLTAQLGGPRIYIKRDDLTGLALGGNKTRMLEYLVADALEQGATHLITEGGPQSNHVRQTLAAARLTGLETVIVSNTTDPNPPVQGNFLLDHIFGIEYHRVSEERDRPARMAQLADELAANGYVPYVIPGGGSNGVGALGYVAAMLELNYQLWDQGVSASAFYLPNGGGGTHAGVALGAALYGAEYGVRGIMIEDNAAIGAERSWKIVQETAGRLGIACPLTKNDIICVDGFVGEAYAVPTPEGLDAIRLLARAEAILLEPVYSAKAFAGMLADIQCGMYSSKESVIFLHTGGTAALFAMTEELAPILDGNERTRHDATL
ncbi:MAG: D-cysteine desulfhydrase family protein [Chloroflexia bacterium]|nr:D-cysteine desulfhydrase family protein [Chloroflexia bacterium]